MLSKFRKIQVRNSSKETKLFFEYSREYRFSPPSITKGRLFRNLYNCWLAQSKPLEINSYEMIRERKDFTE